MRTPRRLSRTLRLELLESRTLLAADLRLVSDLNTEPSTARPNVSVIGTLGDDAYFIARHKVDGLSLWKTDGTETGTRVVTEFESGRFTYLIDSTTTGDELYFVLEVGTSHHEVWSSDGTADGTRLIKSLAAPFAGARMPNQLTAVGNDVFFSAWDQAHGQELWKSDGTTEGTALLMDLEVGFEKESFPRDLFASDGQLFFTARTTDADGVSARRLWKSDGTAEGTRLAGTDRPSWSESVGGKRFFTKLENDTGMELWVTDESGEGETLLKDIYAGPNSAEPENLTNLGGTLYFTATDGIHGRELWKTDGTEAGTELVIDLSTGASDSDPRSLTVVSNKLYFLADGNNLWCSDGTQAGTIMLRDNVGPMALGGLEDVLVFSVADRPRDRELWKTDGTVTGTEQVLDIEVGTGDSKPFSLMPVGQKLFFFTRPTFAETSLWVSDGTEAGTLLLEESLDGFPLNDIAMGNLFYFWLDGESDNGLWRSDGSVAGTQLIKSFPNASSAGLVTNGLVTNGADMLFFSVNTGPEKTLWRSDGTEAGTIQIEGVSPVMEAGSESLDGKLFFAGNDEAHGWELWSSDGTEAGTNLVTDLAEGLDSSRPFLIGVVNGFLLFSTMDGELFRTDGTLAGTTRLDENIDTSRYRRVGGTIAAVKNDELYFAAFTNEGYSIVKTNGMEAGTEIVIGGLPSDDEESLPDHLTAVGNHVFFVTPVGANEATREILWSTDGTEAGTSHFSDFIPDRPSSERFGSLTVLEDQLFITVNSELWQVDPVSEERTKVVDAAGRHVSMLTSRPVSIGGDLFFGAWSSEFGSELFRLSLLGNKTHRIGDFNSDGTTDFADFLVLSTNFGNQVTDVSMGDANEDGFVTFADFLILSANFKTSD